MSRALEVALSAGLVALDSGLLCRETIPSVELAALRSRRQEIVDCLKPASRKTIAMVLASLAGMASQAVSDADEAAAMARQDIDDLSDLSAWALESAARAFRRGEVDDGKWRPTTGQLRKEARRRENDVRAEWYKIGRLLDAPAISAPRPEYIPQAEVEEIHKRIRVIAGRG